MKHFPFKILIVCILLPPVLYILSIQTLEGHLQKRYAQEIEDSYIGDTADLFQGRVRIQDAIGRNIDQYLHSRRLLTMGVTAKVTVTTKKNTLLYPAMYDPENKGETPAASSNLIAQENFRLLNEGLLIDLDLSIEHNRLLSNVILGSYIFLSIVVLFVFYRAGGRKMVSEEQAREVEIKRLTALEEKHASRMKTLDQEREHLSTEIAQVKKRLAVEKEKQSQSEDEILEEMVSLEEQLQDNMAQQKEQQEEIEALEAKIAQYETGAKKSQTQRKKAADMLQKRFKTLYKNLAVHDRAVKGFSGLTADLQLKAEEVIHQLDDDPSLVTIKRKVFGRKNRETVLEVIFAYKGRLYFRNSKAQGLEVLSIGTKHTQGKDLGFLDNL